VPCLGGSCGLLRPKRGAFEGDSERFRRAGCFLLEAAQCSARMTQGQ
jgi:hypothetical protein